MKKQRTERVYIDGVPLVSLIESFQQAVEKYGKDVFFNSEIECDYGDNYVENTFVYYSDETDTECDHRVLREKALAEQRLEQDRKQYEVLKKRFEDKQ